MHLSDVYRQQGAKRKHDNVRLFWMKNNIKTIWKFVCVSECVCLSEKMVVCVFARDYKWFRSVFKSKET